jgi:glycosyltransferase involved in cell wall biosynthesis
LIPALDEERALPLVLADLPPGLVDLVVVVDNGSRDGTARVARERGCEVVFEPRRGYGRACQTGLAWLLDSGAPALADSDVIVFLDADYSDYPEDLPALLEPLLSGRADLVIGSRVLGGAGMRAMLPQAWFGNRLACLLMRVLFGARTSDLGPFRAVRVGALRHLCMRDPDFGWTIEMQLKAHTAQLAVREVPVRYRERIGQSKITGTLLGTLRAGAKILAWIFAWRLATLIPARRIPRYRAPERSGSRRCPAPNRTSPGKE